MLTKSTEEKSKYINMDVLATKQQLLSSTIPTNIHVFQYQYHTLACMRERERERIYETMILNQDTIKTFKFHSSHL